MRSTRFERRRGDSNATRIPRPSGTPASRWSNSMLHAVSRSASTCSGPTSWENETAYGKGDRYRARGRRRSARGAPRSACRRTRGRRCCRVRRRAHTSPDVLAHVRAVHVLARPPSCRPGQVGFEAEERGFQILVGIALLVVGLFIVHALGTWLARRDPQPELPRHRDNALISASISRTLRIRGTRQKVVSTDRVRPNVEPSGRGVAPYCICG
jgi:hypothetical protein